MRSKNDNKYKNNLTNTPVSVQKAFRNTNVAIKTLTVRSTAPSFCIIYYNINCNSLYHTTGLSISEMVFKNLDYGLRAFGIIGKRLGLI